MQALIQRVLSINMFFMGVLVAGCTPQSPVEQSNQQAILRVDQLEKQILKLQQDMQLAQQQIKPVELGQQMLELQLRHGRLWFTGARENWILAAFQLHELREALNAVVEDNPDDAALQPERLAEVLPAMMNPALEQLQKAIDAQDHAQFERGYDAVTAACNACHTVAGFGFNQFQRPQTPILDNQKY